MTVNTTGYEDLIKAVMSVVSAIQNSEVDDGLDYIKEQGEEIRHIIDNYNLYIGSQLKVCIGGYEIWIDTADKVVSGYFLHQRFEHWYRRDSMELSECLQNQYNMQSMYWK